MHQRDYNKTEEWHPSPFKLLAGCATFPFTLVYSKWRKNVEEAEFGDEPRNEKNTGPNARQSKKDGSQYRRRQPAGSRRKRAPNPSERPSPGKKGRVVKERGGREEYEENPPKRIEQSAAKLRGNPVNYQKSPKVSRFRSTRRPSGHEHLRTSPPMNEKHRVQYTRNQQLPRCCTSAEKMKKMCPSLAKEIDGHDPESSSFSKNSMCKDCVEKYEKGIQMNYIRNLTILWFPPNFSQSKFGDRSAGSNACTLITILVSYKCHKTGLKLNNIRLQEAWEPLMNILAESIVEGNSIHERLRRDGKLIDDNLTVPEAIDATKEHVKTVNEWESTVVSMRMKTSLFDYLSNRVMEWYSTPLSQEGSDLYVIVISQNRSVVMIFQKEAETVTLVDSHSHYPHGAAIAQVPFKKLRELCNWYACILKDSAERPIHQYELSYIYFAK